MVLAARSKSIQKGDYGHRLEDGVRILTQGEDSKIGSPVFGLTEDDEKVRMPKGEYEMEDGRVMKIDKTGHFAGFFTKKTIEQYKHLEISAKLNGIVRKLALSNARKRISGEKELKSIMRTNQINMAK